MIEAPLLEQHQPDWNNPAGKLAREISELERADRLLAA
jgi:hypothetical protein